jgi:lipoyl(octanoyl) transferase
VKRADIPASIPSENPVHWQVSTSPVGYPDAVQRMEQEVMSIRNGTAPELVWLLEHPAIYTSGTSAKRGDLLSPRFPVFQTGRGGQFTYHGPGQRIAYVMLDIRNRGNDVRAFVAALENWIIKTLAEFQIIGERREDRVGVWVNGEDGENKIAALGIRIRHGITFHGISINVSPDLSHYDGIVACGVHDHGVTSLKQLGVKASLQDVDKALRKTFLPIFGPITEQH